MIVAKMSEIAAAGAGVGAAGAVETPTDGGGRGLHDVVDGLI